MKKVTRRSLRKFKRKVERLERELQRQRDYRRLADRERRYLRGLETIDEWEPWGGGRLWMDKSRRDRRWSQMSRDALIEELEVVRENYLTAFNELARSERRRAKVEQELRELKRQRGNDCRG